MALIEFTVAGDPVPQGSMTAFPYLERCGTCRPNRPCGNRNCWHGRVARARVAHDDDGKMKAWRELVAVTARSALAVARWPSRPAFAEGAPVALGVVFDLVRPKGHWLPSGSLSAEGKRYPYPTREHSGDADKLLRAVCDALTGVLFPTDAQVVLPVPGKRWTAGQQRAGALHVIAGEVGEASQILNRVSVYFGAATNLELFR